MRTLGRRWFKMRQSYLLSCKDDKILYISPTEARLNFQHECNQSRSYRCSCTGPSVVFCTASDTVCCMSHPVCGNLQERVYIYKPHECNQASSYRCSCTGPGVMLGTTSDTMCCMSHPFCGNLQITVHPICRAFWDNLGLIVLH